MEGGLSVDFILKRASRIWQRSVPSFLIGSIPPRSDFSVSRYEETIRRVEGGPMSVVEQDEKSKKRTAPERLELSIL